MLQSHLCASLLPGFCCVCSLLAAAPPALEKSAKVDGFVPFYWGAKGELWLEVGQPGREFLYVTSLPAGVGSNDIGLDRGQLGDTHVVRWERSGNKVLLIASNQGYRANSTDDNERRAVRESFAETVLWGFEASVQDDGRVLVDATNFFLRDAHGVAETLQRARQGTYRAGCVAQRLLSRRARKISPRTPKWRPPSRSPAAPAGQLLEHRHAVARRRHRADAPQLHRAARARFRAARV